MYVVAMQQLLSVGSIWYFMLDIRELNARVSSSLAHLSTHRRRFLQALGFFASSTADMRFSPQGGRCRIAQAIKCSHAIWLGS